MYVREETAVLLYVTKSVCPVCLKTLTAEISGDADGVYMDKTCPEHGHFHSLIWEDSAENYLRWLEYGGLCRLRLLPARLLGADDHQPLQHGLPRVLHAGQKGAHT